MQNSQPYWKKNHKNRGSIKYPTVRSAVKRKPHDKGFPVPIPPAVVEVDEEDSVSSQDYESGTNDSDLEDADRPRKFNQAQLNDFVQDLEFSKTRSELLGSRLKERNLLDKGVNITVFRERPSKTSVKAVLLHIGNDSATLTCH